MGSGPSPSAGVRSGCDPFGSRAARDGRLRGRSANAQNESLARTKIVVISGYACEEDRRLSRDIGVDEHLAKPVRFSELLRVVTETGRIPRT